MQDLPRGSVTFLFTDIEHSVRLWEEIPDIMREALARHDMLLRHICTAQEGYVFKTIGDAFCVVFPCPANALAAAVTAQCALQSLPLSDGAVPLSNAGPFPFKVRMALHTGEAEQRDQDYFGPEINRVARFLILGHGGQILLSRATCEQIKGTLPEGVTLRPLGEHYLKDLPRPEPVFQLIHPALPSAFPPLRTLEASSHHLPIPGTSFIGREQEVVEIKRLLTTTRLLTLHGAGGCGKTRLAIQVGSEQIDAYYDGIWFVALDSLTEGQLIPQAIASVVGVQEEPGQPLLNTLISRLRLRSLLLILDNCEHLLVFCASLVQTLLQACPHLQILATSREPLGVTDEICRSVPSLSLPTIRRRSQEEGKIAREPSCEAVQLFVERATTAQPSFTLTSASIASVEKICRHLDGIPLAIELAAARVKAMSVRQIAERLNTLFRLLHPDGNSTLRPRQQTLRALIDWSYHLLTAKEQMLFQHLSIFSGGWTLEAAEAVCVDSGVGYLVSGIANDSVDPNPTTNTQYLIRDSKYLSAIENRKSKIENGEVLDLLASLVSKSLVIYDPQQERYRLLESMRQYGLEKLADTGEEQSLRERHRNWFLTLAEQAEPELQGPNQQSWLDRLENEHDNLRSALQWSVDHQEISLRLASALWRFWSVRSYLSEGRGYLEEALLRRGQASDRVRAQALNRAGVLAWMQGDYAGAKGHIKHSLALRQKLDDRPGIAGLFNNLGCMAQAQGDSFEARRYLEESLRIYRELNDTPRIGEVLTNLGGIASEQGQYETACLRLEEGLTIHRQLQHTGHIASTLHNLAEALRKQGRWEQAAPLFRESLQLRQELKDQRGIAFSLLGLSVAARYQGDTVRAALLLSAAEAIWLDIDASLPPTNRQEHHSEADALRSTLGETEFAAAWERGQQMTLEEVVECALQHSKT